MSERLLRLIRPEEAELSRVDPLDDRTIEIARSILTDIESRGEPAVREHAERLGDLEPGAPLVLGRDELNMALGACDAEARAHLEAAAESIRVFAEGQRASLKDFRMPIPGLPGGDMGHELAPVEVAGCYAPGGRYPLPSSVLMTAVTARAAGVPTVVVASPKPQPATLAAAAISDADALIAVGGAQAIGAMVHGTSATPRADAVVGPGNRFVTAAKQLVGGRVAIDMLAGPSEVLIIADDSADAGTLAADLLAQAEHDDDAAAILVTTSRDLADAVEAELAAQLETLPTATVARRALQNSFCVLCDAIDQAIDVSDRLAPEHLEIQTRDAEETAAACNHYGAVFIGEGAAEAIGDYGVGPNHTLPTGGTARSFAGLSVMTFLRMRTYIRGGGEVSTPERTGLIRRTAALARIEGLEAHARSAERRLSR